MPKTPSNHRAPWTPADNKQLKQLVKQNTPTPLIAHKLQRTEDAVRQHAASMDLSLSRRRGAPAARRSSTGTPTTARAVAPGARIIAICSRDASAA